MAARPLPAGMADELERVTGTPADEPVISPATASCPNCVYVDEFRKNDFQCRRYPPTPLLFGFKPPPLEGAEPIAVINAMFPRMAITSVCGEFKHKHPEKAT